MPRPTKYQLLAVLARHQGADRGASVEALAKAIDCHPRHVRSLVTELREDGVAVCGHPKTGYFVASNPAELERTCQFLRSRALRSLTLEAQLRRIPLPDLIGQLHLPT